jgi:uncharacterized protein YggT (Ycf19 family)
MFTFSEVSFNLLAFRLESAEAVKLDVATRMKLSSLLALKLSAQGTPVSTLDEVVHERYYFPRWGMSADALAGLLNALTFRFLSPLRRMVPPIGGTLDLSALIFIVIAQLVLMLPVHWLEGAVVQAFRGGAL